MSKDNKPVNSTGTNNGKEDEVESAIKNARPRGAMILKVATWDRRTALYRSLRAQEQLYEVALGGSLSPQQSTLVKDLVHSQAYLASIDSYLQSLKSVVRRGKVHAVLVERIRQSANIRETLRCLGLKRVPREVPDLAKEISGDEG